VAAGLGIAFLGGCNATLNTQVAPASDAAIAAPTANASASSLSAMFFGMSSEDGSGVSDQEWQSFLVQDIAPRFGEFTVLDAMGQYRYGSGVLAAEQTKIVLLVHDGSPDAATHMAAIARAYRERFGQEAVLCVSAQAQVAP
jgi:hypothetical protein